MTLTNEIKLLRLKVKTRIWLRHHFTLLLIILVIGIVSVPTARGAEIAQNGTAKVEVGSEVQTSAYTVPDLCSLSTVYCDNERYARVTEYGWTGNKMANGQYPFIGAVAVSDRTIPLGTKLIMDGKEYVVADRTAKWVHDKFTEADLTVDVYSKNPHGKSYKNIELK